MNAGIAAGVFSISTGGDRGGRLPLYVSAVPVAAVGQVGGRQVGRPAVQPQRLALVHVRRAEVGQPARGHQPAAEPAQPAEPVRLVECRVGVGRRRVPGQRRAVEARRADVQAAVGQHGEVEPAAGAEVDRAHPALEAVAEFAQADAGELAHVTPALGQLGAGEGFAVESWHGCPLLGGLCRLRAS